MRRASSWESGTRIVCIREPCCIPYIDIGNNAVRATMAAPTIAAHHGISNVLCRPSTSRRAKSGGQKPSSASPGAKSVLSMVSTLSEEPAVIPWPSLGSGLLPISRAAALSAGDPSIDRPGSPVRAVRLLRLRAVRRKVVRQSPWESRAEQSDGHPTPRESKAGDLASSEAARIANRGARRDAREEVLV
eukprot:scaffold103640_cov28-Tisochrysis_lutea.AAC.2